MARTSTLAPQELKEVAEVVERLNKVDMPNVELSTVECDIRLCSPDGDMLGRVVWSNDEWQFTQEDQ